MGAYIPLESVQVRPTDSTFQVNSKNRFHIQLSELVLNFTKKNQSKTILISNVGWDKLGFPGVVKVNSAFTVEEDLPSIFLPDKSYPITVSVGDLAAGQYEGGIYIDVGDSYGYKFVKLTANIT